jgi:hypothetical protein
MCAGDGRDLLGALQDHPARSRVRARLVELNAELAATARRATRRAGLGGIEVVVGDAGTTNAYLGAVPADLVLVCGVFGNISIADVERTIRALPALCAAGATVVWTRHRRQPDLTPLIRGWFRAAGFNEVAWEAVPDSMVTVGAARLEALPVPFQPEVRLFSFVDRLSVFVMRRTVTPLVRMSMSGAWPASSVAPEIAPMSSALAANDSVRNYAQAPSLMTRQSSAPSASRNSRSVIGFFMSVIALLRWLRG